MLIEKSTYVKLTVRSFAEIDKDFNRINSLKTLSMNRSLAEINKGYKRMNLLIAKDR